MTYLGIDPGKSGAIAFLPDDHGTPWTIATDSTHRDLAEAVLEHCDPESYAFALLEYVSSSPQMGVKSAFTFGQSFGALEMLLAATGVPFERITPRKWQTAMACLSGGDKNVTKRRAQELFPSLKVTHRNADALLLAELARRTRR